MGAEGVWRRMSPCQQTRDKSNNTHCVPLSVRPQVPVRVGLGKAIEYFRKVRLPPLPLRLQ